MGFPTWTLWGMGISGLVALVLIGLALLAQSPVALSRFGLSSAHLQQRIRAFTGYGFAALLLALGFFLAGVPIGEQTGPQTIVVVTATATITPPGDAVVADAGEDVTTAVANTTPEPNLSDGTPQTGAFGGPPPSQATEEAATTPELDATETIAPFPTASLIATATASPTPTATATATQTPTPTTTPTPIRGETAVLNLQGGTVWIQRTPGGQNLVILNDRDIVLLQPGHANQAGILWREIRTVDGVLGWVPEEWLLYD